MRAGGASWVSPGCGSRSRWGVRGWQLPRQAQETAGSAVAHLMLPMWPRPVRGASGGVVET
eukprot:5889088-Alexandrium_andersonii.AAC.1